MCIRAGSEPSCHTTSTGTRSPKSVLMASTPESSRARTLPANQSRAAGLVKSTMPMPATHWSVCQTEPSGRRSR